MSDPSGGHAPPGRAGASVEIARLSHTFAGDPPVPTLDDVSLRAAPGEFVAIVGPSGCGKSTLLRVLAGLVVPDRGRCEVDGTSTIDRPGAVAWQPQRDLLIPSRRVLANATVGAEIGGVDRAEARRRAIALLDRFGLGGFERAWPSELSGGMRQRVALLRTFLQPRPILLLDEPFGALDALTRRDLQQWLQGVWASDGRTVMLVTHDVDEAITLADRVVVLSPRPARVLADEAIDLGRPRRPDDVTDPRFVEHKRAVLAALGG
ncbi:MAG: ABC transporter ATP-binding protein [Actinomycetota bacterium]|nr:ABC transporter ATP-binding protein [Actinomycetota bacterium]